jgi:hypothetical protein
MPEGDNPSFCHKQITRTVIGKSSNFIYELMNTFNDIALVCIGKALSPDKSKLFLAVE